MCVVTCHHIHKFRHILRNGECQIFFDGSTPIRIARRLESVSLTAVETTEQSARLGAIPTSCARHGLWHTVSLNAVGWMEWGNVVRVGCTVDACRRQLRPSSRRTTAFSSEAWSALSSSVARTVRRSGRDGGFRPGAELLSNTDTTCECDLYVHDHATHGSCAVRCPCWLDTD